MNSFILPAQNTATMTQETKKFFMQKALMQARVSLRRDEVPIGAVIVNKEGVIIARAYNQMEAKKSQLAHAETQAIARACKAVGNWRLIGCFIYVTLEPCLMCLGLIQLSRLEGVIYGAQSHLFGALSLGAQQIPLYKKSFVIEGGVEEKQSIELLQTFFKKIRRTRKVSSETKNRSS